MENTTKLYQVQVRVTFPGNQTPYAASGIYIDDHETPREVICELVEEHLRARPKAKDARFKVQLNLINVEFVFKSVLK